VSSRADDQPNEASPLAGSSEPEDARYERFLTASAQVHGAMLQLAENRRGRTDAMMWQVPALALTAEAFLLSISLAPDTRALGRLVASIAGFIVISASLQLMLKHRYHERMYAEWLERVETDFADKDMRSAGSGSGILRFHDRNAMEAFAFRGRQHPWKQGPASLQRLVVDLSSVTVWGWALGLLLLLDSAIFIIALGISFGVWDPL
jgi:hypothetical protein